MSGSDRPLGLGPLARALLVVFLAAGTYLRVEGFWNLPLYGDEYHNLSILAQDWRGIWTSFDDRGSHVAFPLLQRASQELLGRGVWVLRLPALAAGIGGLLICYPLARRLVGSTAAVIATAGFALSPMHVYYSRFARPYALVMFLALVLVFLLDVALHAKRRAALAWVGAGLVTGLLPFVHLSSIGVVAALGLGAVSLAWLRERSARTLLGPLSALALGTVVCVALYAPAWDALRLYMDRRTEGPPPEPFDPLGIATLLSGGRVAGVLLSVALPIAVAGLAGHRPATAVWLAAVVAGPAVVLALTRPHGMAYAYARYLGAALPFLLMGASWLVAAAVRSQSAAVAAGALAVLAAYAAGPLSPARPDDGPFSNTYLALRALPAFDRPYPGTPAFYATLADDPEVHCIIEARPLLSRSVLLYRNYYLQHGKRVLLGRLEANGPAVEGPYSWLQSPDLVEQSGADTLILHRDLRDEVAGYWEFVYGQAWPEIENRADRTFMERNRDYSPPRRGLARLEAQLEARLGRPVYRDESIVAWKLR